MMENRLFENIRRYRKENGLTQERLAEIAGVSVAAVSKWESGQSLPELKTVVAMAELFGVSIDALLGFKLRGNSPAEAAERIAGCIRAKDYGAGTLEAEKALEKYPNHFDIVYRSAGLFRAKGNDLHDRRALLRAVELLRHASTLADQSQDGRVSALTIGNEIARIYILLRDDARAVAQLKSANAGGVNDALIGYTLAAYLASPEEAKPYLSHALLSVGTALFQICTGYANAYLAQEDYASALDIVLWLRGALAGLKKPGQVSFLDREEAILLAGCAQFAMLAGNAAQAQTYLKEAWRLAKSFDAAPDYQAAGIKHYCGEDRAASFSEIGGTTAQSAVTGMLSANRATGESLTAMWEEMKRDETV